MKKFATIIIVSAFTTFCVGAAAQSLQRNGLRGIDIDAPNRAETMRKLDTSGRFERAYRQQPPLIPHAIDQYEIDLKVNQCMRCHDWPYNVDEGAPKISETHYVSRDGVALDTVSPRRWFCNQCHVPQVQTRPLVGNEFRSAIDVK